MVSNAGKAVTLALPDMTGTGWVWSDLGAFLPHWHYLGLPTRA